MRFLIANHIFTFMLPVFLVCGCRSTQQKTADSLLKKWPYEIDQEIAKIDDRVVDGIGKDGLQTYYWKTDEYLKSPKAENLRKEGLSSIMRITNAEHQIALEKLLKKNSFQLCSKKETVDFFKMHNLDKYEIFPIVHLWKLENDIYLLIRHMGGSSGEREYSFYIKSIEIWEGFDFPPKAQQIKKLAARIQTMEKQMRRAD